MCCQRANCVRVARTIRHANIVESLGNVNSNLVLFSIDFLQAIYIGEASTPTVICFHFEQKLNDKTTVNSRFQLSETHQIYSPFSVITFYTHIQHWLLSFSLSPSLSSPFSQVLFPLVIRIESDEVNQAENWAKMHTNF